MNTWKPEPPPEELSDPERGTAWIEPDFNPAGYLRLRRSIDAQIAADRDGAERSMRGLTVILGAAMLTLMGATGALVLLRWAGWL